MKYGHPGQSVIIVAGGSGKRMLSSVPKQFLLLKGKPILIHTIEKFRQALPKAKIIVVLPADSIDYLNNYFSIYPFFSDITVVEGGPERFHSVKNGLNTIEDEGIVAIHDGVRPLVSLKTITEGMKLASIKGTAIPFVYARESVRIISGPLNKATKRENIALIQTPQCFRVQLIKDAYRQAFRKEFTDDATVAEAAGNSIFLFEGTYDNIKITTPEDLRIAEALLQK